MDLRDRPADTGIRAEVRRFLAANVVGDFAVVRGRGGPGDEHELFEGTAPLGAGAGRRGLDRDRLAARVRRARGTLQHPQVLFFEEYVRARAPGRGSIGEGLFGPTIIQFGTASEAAVSRAHPRRRAVVPGVLRAERRERPRERADTRSARGRRVGRHRAEDLDVARPSRRLVLRALPHRCRRAQPQGPQLPAGPHAPARRRVPADRAASPGRASSTRCSSMARGRRPRT